MQKLITILALTLTMTIPATYVAAQANTPVDVFDDICNRVNVGDAASSAPCRDKEVGNQNPLYGPEGILTKVFNIISLMVGIAAVISIIAAGYKFVTSGSNPEEVTKAREYIQYALIGLILAAAAQALVRLVLLKI